ncbi:Serine/threonine-protein kinase Nek4 [Dispira parvispora]|uniref:non-specific serine/threonine protein kinase n=1 Tax=Dispira parvispora TaxID=1520584 RepID=A0A9W8ATR1_9FUNG|nr:Serine/threonine-protein kinase Nek4 [Dispira parvispora]
MARVPDYRMVTIIGKGGRGIVYKAALTRSHCTPTAPRRQLSEYVAIKRLDRHGKHIDPATSENGQLWQCQVKMLKRTQHPHILHYYDAFVTHQHYYVVTEYVDGGDFGTLVDDQRVRGPFADRLIHRWLNQLAQALDYLHTLRIIHRDITPRNLLYRPRDGALLLSDFDLALELPPGHGWFEDRYAVGTPNYMAPEIYNRQRYSPASDMWAFGCFAFELVNLRLAFPGTHLPDIMAKVRRGLLFSDLSSMNRWSGFRGIVQDTLCADPGIRLTAQGALGRLGRFGVSQQRVVKPSPINPTDFIATPRLRNLQPRTPEPNPLPVTAMASESSTWSPHHPWIHLSNAPPSSPVSSFEGLERCVGWVTSQIGRSVFIQLYTAAHRYCRQNQDLNKLCTTAEFNQLCRRYNVTQPIQALLALIVKTESQLYQRAFS